MKQLLKRSLALLLAVLTMATAVSAANKSGYSDVPDKHWASQSIAQCRQYDLLQGVGNGKFGLGQKMTRAAYASALCRLMGWKTVTPEKGSFSDNQDTKKWYYSAVETAAAHDVFPGSGTKCRPNDAVTRDEMAAMTMRALGYSVLAGIIADADAQPVQSGVSGFAGLTGSIGKNCPFGDCTTNRGYIALAYRMGIMTGVNKYNFDPKGTATREQAAAVLLRTYGRLHANVSVKDAHWVTANGEPRTLDVPKDCITAVSHTARKGEQAVSPRAALEEVYAAARIAGEGGSVLLRTAPLAQSVKDGKTVSAARELGSGELGALLADSAMTQHRSAKYQSSCLYHPEKDGTTTVVWYESEADRAEKVELCRLLGIKNVYLLGGAQA